MSALANLLVVGVPKAGTTSLFDHLAQHPDVCGASVKEPRYFTPTRWGRPPSLSVAEYDALFAEPARRYRLEATPDYFAGGAPLIEHVLATLAEPRALVSLREPTDRLWSHYRFKRLNGRFDQSIDFETFLDRCEAVIASGRQDDPDVGTWRELANGLYVDHLHAWFDAFDDAQFRVVFFDDLAARPAAVVGDLFAWLGLDPVPPSAMDLRPRNEQLHARSLAAHQRLKRLARPLLRSAGGTAVVATVKRGYRMANSRRDRAPDMPSELRDRVDATYRASNAALARCLHERGYRRLPPWLAAHLPTVGSATGGDR